MSRRLPSGSRRDPDDWSDLPLWIRLATSEPAMGAYGAVVLWILVSIAHLFGY